MTLRAVKYSNDTLHDNITRPKVLRWMVRTLPPHAMRLPCDKHWWQSWEGEGLMQQLWCDRSTEQLYLMPDLAGAQGSSCWGTLLGNFVNAQPTSLWWRSWCNLPMSEQ